MTFCIITHVPHGKISSNYFAYAPYVKEMNIWLKYVDKVIIVAPLNLSEKTSIEIEYNHSNIEFNTVEKFNVLSIASVFKTLVQVPIILMAIYKAMKKADHIHLRCPGNMGLMGCIMQIFFPSKPKTAKYAGNWDLKAKQPLSYQIQKWILNNTFLTKNMNVLVYGKWENSSKNIKPFFTASYLENEKQPVEKRNLDGALNFMFVGTLAKGKQPLYAIQLVQKIKEHFPESILQIFGNGLEKETLQNYIATHNLEKIVFLRGNKTQEEIKKEYQKNHFVILPSLSEGWPKVVAEGMFWGCLPIATSVSCVPNMLADEQRGVLLSLDLEKDFDKMSQLLQNENDYQVRVEKAVEWSRTYTIDKFEIEIKKLIKA